MDGGIEQQHKIEAIKTTILLHERIFNQQVKELHRLHKAQRELMEELKMEIQKPFKKVQFPNSQFHEGQGKGKGKGKGKGIDIGGSSLMSGPRFQPSSNSNISDTNMEISDNEDKINLTLAL